MTGIVSFGAYVPRLRLRRESIGRHMSWLVPALASAKGEKAICNWDEDSLTMAVAAARDCLAGAATTDVAGLTLASTTLPFADRLNAGVVGAALNLSEQLLAIDVTCSQKAGTSALVTALEAVRGRETGAYLVTASDKREARSASQLELLLGDGAAALLVGDDDVIAEFEGSHSVTCDFVDHYRGSHSAFDYTWEDRWVRDVGYAQILPDAIRGLLGELGLGIEDVDRLIYPGLQKRDHATVAKALGVDQDSLQDPLHDACGQTGAAHPLLMLAAALEQASPGDRIVVASFGQGSDVLSFRVTDRIATRSRSKPVARSLANRSVTDNYMKYLRFRDLVVTETGLRAEAPTQTALTTLWRERRTILGLVGGRCEACGTPQFPKSEVCVVPECHATHSQVDHAFSGRPAYVKSFTGDMLAVSPDPPAVYGMVEFDGGGRLMTDFTDVRLEEVSVGMPMEMSFRRHAHDAVRGFTGYFWKAVPRAGGVGPDE